MLVSLIGLGLLVGLVIAWRLVRLRRWVQACLWWLVGMPALLSALVWLAGRM